jgi:hypothetical protein
LDGQAGGRRWSWKEPPDDKPHGCTAVKGRADFSESRPDKGRMLLMKSTAIGISLVTLVFSGLANGQTPPVSVFTVDVDGTGYSLDETDRSKVAKDVSVSAATPVANFNQFVTLGDVVEINGRRAKGVFVGSGITLLLRPEPAPGQAIADVMRGSFSHYYLELLQEDGTPVGTLIADGFFGGPAPPGSPRIAANSNLTITGGTGAFLGARGQLTFTTRPTRPIVRTPTETSVREDPALRRVHPPSRGDRLLIILIPLKAPEIHAVFHGDFSPVTTASPAHPGEVLIAAATGLGPTRPGVDPGSPFPTFPDAPPEQVNSPIEVTAGGKPADVVNKIGWPRTKDMYRIDFRVPEYAAGDISVQVTAAWITGPEFRIPVR